MRRYLVLLVILSIFAIPSACTEIAYSSGPNGEKPVGQNNITEYKGTDLVSFTTSNSPRGPTSNYNRTKEKTVDDIKDEINKKINRGNEDVRSKGLILAAGRSGAQRIDQICAIYDYMARNWSFASDWRGVDEFQYSNFTLELGKESGYSGIGDCDDFSILLSALIESIGGTPRIILAYSPSGGHAYTEVYMGNNNNTDIDRMKKWLRKEYKVNEVYIHFDPEKGDVWLNMDWWTEEGEEGAVLHPEGPFFQATSQVPIYIQEETAKSPLTPIENQPPKPHFNYSPLHPYVNDVVSFNASGSFDPDGKIVDYEWDFGDGDTSHKLISRHVYSNEGNFSATLTLTDDEGGESTKTYNICVKEPLPEAIGTYTPVNPKVGEDIAFDATKSTDKRGQIIRYEWDFDDGYSGKRASIKHSYTDSGIYNVNLTVFNDKGLCSSTSIEVNVRQEDVRQEDVRQEVVRQEVEQTSSKPTDEVHKESLPEAVFSYSPTEPNAEQVITFSASRSVSNDGEIVNCEWNFGDGYSGKGVSISHLYSDSGTYDVSLTVTNDKGRSHTTTKTLLINEAESTVSKREVKGTTPSSSSPYNTLIEPEGNYATITITSAQYQGFDVKVDDVLIGSDGKGGDALDGIYTFKVTGNQQHTIRAEHPYNWKWWQYPYNAGESYSYDF